MPNKRFKQNSVSTKIKSSGKRSKKSQSLLLALDQGTTGTTAILIDTDLKVLGQVNVEFPQVYPQPGWVEHDLEDIWKSTLKAIRLVFQKTGVHSHQILGIGITNQRETVGFWQAKTGDPLRNAVVWQDRRTASFCESEKQSGHEAMISEKTGLLLDPYFSASKIKWVLEQDRRCLTQAKKGQLRIGTVDTFLIHKLTGGRAHLTDVTNASRTSLFNLHSLKWDQDLLKFFNVSVDILAQVKDSGAHYGTTLGVPGLPDGIPICGVLGDQQAALLGQACVDPGMAKCTFGTGAFLMLNTGEHPVVSKHRLLSTLAWKFGSQVAYALEGSAFSAGACVQWFRDQLKLIQKSKDIESLARKSKTSAGVVFVPGFVGLGAPYWLPDVRASFFGLSRGSGPQEMARAVLEGIALVNTDILRAMEQDVASVRGLSSVGLRSLRVDGGASHNDLLMEIQAGLLGVPLERPKIVETTALGAAFAAGLQLGVWPTLEDVKKSWQRQRQFRPQMKAEIRAGLLKAWHGCLENFKNTGGA